MNKLVRLLYRIREKINDNWVEVLDLKAFMFGFSLEKGFNIAYNDKNLILEVSSSTHFKIEGNEKLVIGIGKV